MKKLIQLASLEGKPGLKIEAEILGSFGIHKSIMSNGLASKNRFSVTVVSAGGTLGYGLKKKDAMRYAERMQGERNDWDRMTVAKWKKMPKKEIERLRKIKDEVLG